MCLVVDQVTVLLGVLDLSFRPGFVQVGMGCFYCFWEESTFLHLDGFKPIDFTKRLDFFFVSLV